MFVERASLARLHAIKTERISKNQKRQDAGRRPLGRRLRHSEVDVDVIQDAVRRPREATKSQLRLFVIEDENQGWPELADPQEERRRRFPRRNETVRHAVAATFRTSVSRTAPKVSRSENDVEGWRRMAAQAGLAVEGESCNRGTPKPHDMNTAAGRRGGHGGGKVGLTIGSCLSATLPLP